VLHGIPDVDKAHLLHAHLCLIPAYVSCVPPAHARLPRDLLALDHHRRVSLEPLLFTGHPINPNHYSATPPHHGPRHLMFYHDINLGAPTRCYVLPIGVGYSCAQAVVFPHRNLYCAMVGLGVLGHSYSEWGGGHRRRTNGGGDKMLRGGGATAAVPGGGLAPTVMMMPHNRGYDLGVGGFLAFDHRGGGG
jgi:hypothetical protein